MLFPFGIVSFAALAATTSQTIPPTQPPVTATDPPAVSPVSSKVPLPADTTPDYPGAIWVSASPANYQTANRPIDEAITMIVIHDVEGSAISAVRWFENPTAKASSHYVVDSVSGIVYQLIKEHDIAWHAGNHEANHHGIGIEHEGFAYKPGFYNPVEYEASAKLVRSISARYNIPRDRTHIIGHAEVPNAAHPGQFGGSGGHTDPGPWWDWDSYMTLVRNDATFAPAPAIAATLRPGESVTEKLTFTNAGDDLWACPVKSRGADRASETTNAAAQRALGLIYLGTWNPTFAPMSPASVFFGKGWASPRYIVPAEGDVAPGATGTFTFDLHGPRTLGPVTEQYRLYKLAVAPHAPVAFGPTITATIQVVPWDLTVDTVSPDGGFKADGWKADKSDDRSFYTFEAPKEKGGVATAAAQWSTKLPLDGLWDVYVRAPTDKHQSHKFTYTVQTAGATPPDAGVSVTMDLTKSEGDWQKLGRFPLRGGKLSAQVSLAPDGDPGSLVTAEAVRFVGPFPDPNAPKGPDPSLFQPGTRP